MGKFMRNPLAVACALLAASSLACAVGWGAWWHYGTCAAGAAMAWVFHRFD